jgi:hypothetical protein
MGMKRRGVQRGMLHSSAVAYIDGVEVLGVQHYRLEQHLQDQRVKLGRGMLCRYVEAAATPSVATFVHAMWQDAIDNGCITPRTQPLPWHGRLRAVLARPVVRRRSSERAQLTRRRANAAILTTAPGL